MTGVAINRRSGRPLMVEDDGRRTSKAGVGGLRREQTLSRRSLIAKWWLMLVAIVMIMLTWTSSYILEDALTETRHLRPFRRSLSAPDAPDRNAAATTASGNMSSSWNFAPDDTIVHIIQTRFMQHQPHLTTLGQARLKIFEHITLPSLKVQTDGRFLWLIRTDPDLDQTVKESLIRLIEGHPNFLVIASNDNPEGFRQTGMKSIKPSDVWSGSHELLRLFHSAAQTRIVVETRLDADDGLNRRFVEFIHTMVPKELRSEKSSWMIYCALNHLEWHHENPFQAIRRDSSLGFIVGVRQKGCVTPGLSFVYGVDVKRSDLQFEADHQQLHQFVPNCHVGAKASACIRLTVDLSPAAIRARTPTSHGMINVVVNNAKGKNLKYSPSGAEVNQQAEMWSAVEKLFSLKKEGIQALRSYILQHMTEIANDNLEGQCTKGHSCKSSSKRLLEEIKSKHLEQ
jgi:hypothetical protein